MDTFVALLKVLGGIVLVGFLIVGINANFGITGNEIADSAGNAVNEFGSVVGTFFGSVIDGGVNESEGVG